MPGSEIQTEIMQAATGFHHPISKVIFPVAQWVFDNSIAFDPPNGMFYADPNAGNQAVAFFFLWGEFSAPGLLHGLEHGHLLQGKALKAGILIQATASGQGEMGFVGDFLIVLLAFASDGQQDHLGLRIDQHIVFDGMAFPLAAVAGGLGLWVFRSLNWPLGAILEVELASFRRQLQLRGMAGGEFSQLVQRPVQTRMQNMDPLVGHRLGHVEHLAKDILGSRFAQIYQDKQQLIFHPEQWAVAVGHKAALLALLLI